MYGKLINGEIVKFKNPIPVDGRLIITSNPIKYGYKKIEYTLPPDDIEGNFDYIWSEDENKIYRIWKEIENYE